MNTEKSFTPEYQAHCERQIEERGWMIQGVYGPPDSAGLSYAYTVGLHRYGLPELLVFSLMPEAADALLNDVGRYMLVAKGLGMRLTGRMEHFNWRIPMHLLAADSKLVEGYIDHPLLRGADSASVLQVVWPDSNGLLPWEAGADRSKHGLQPLLNKATPAQVS